MMNPDEYQQLGIETIPLIPNSKRPLVEAWQRKPTAEQWRNAPTDANIGIRHNGFILNIDADNKKVSSTFDHVMAGLHGLGITSTPIVQTASGIGRGVYLRCDDAPRDIVSRNLSSEVGAGELRVGIGAMSVLPYSQVNGATYKLIDGDWRAMPVVQWRDFVWLLPQQRLITSSDVLPVRLIYRYAPRGTAELFAQIANAERGAKVGKYSSRSEAEAAIVARLILNGWDFAQIRAEFKRRACGHFADMKRHADQYLKTTYSNALGGIMAADAREAIAVDYAAADSGQWIGRTGNSDRAAYMAVLSECYRAGAVETSASVRELSEHAAIAKDTVTKALKRLIDYGLIERAQPATQDGTIAAVWRLGCAPLPTGENRTRVTIEKLSDNRHPVVTSVRLSPVCEIAELSSRAALGKSAVTIYRHLDELEAVSISELARRTGRARSTVRAALLRLESHSLAAQTADDEWLRGTNDLVTVAAELDCSGLADRRRSKHSFERDKYQKWIAMRKEAGAASPRTE